MFHGVNSRRYKTCADRHKVLQSCPGYPEYYRKQLFAAPLADRHLGCGRGCCAHTGRRVVKRLVRFGRWLCTDSDHWAVWSYDVCIELRRGRATFLVLDDECMARLPRPGAVCCLLFAFCPRFPGLVCIAITPFALETSCYNSGPQLTHVTSYNSSSKLPSAVPVIILLLHRILLRWNQTGQKHSGAPDIAHTYLLNYPKTLWVLALITYLEICVRIGSHFWPSPKASLPPKATGLQHFQRGLSTVASVNSGSFAVSSTIVCAALVFKMAFVARDAPELVKWMPAMAQELLEHDVPLVWAARLVFIALAAATGWVSVADVLTRRKGGRASKFAKMRCYGAISFNCGGV